MAKLNVTKQEVARRQIDAAVRMLFGGEDPVAVITVAGAAFRIVRDLCENAGKGKAYQAFNDWIVPGKASEFWAAMNVPANFLKHADRDPTAVLDTVDEALGDAYLMMATLFYADLGLPLTPETNALLTYSWMMNPDFLLDGAPGKDVLKQLHADMGNLGRSEALRLANEALDQMRRSARAALAARDPFSMRV